LSSDDEIAQIAHRTYRALQAKARVEHDRNTGALLTVYAVESFLRRLAMSDHANQLVLKGGMVMAANSIRRMTKDADLSTHDVSNDEAHIRGVVAGIAALTPDPHDGIVIDLSSIRTEVSREDDKYQGIRCKLVAQLGQAKIPFSLDFSFGDPNEATTITLESLVDRPDVELQAYPLTLNLAEKIVTAMQRRDTSTRDRDFGDLWVTSRLHRLDAAELRDHVTTMASHRQQSLISMSEALGEMPDRQQSYALMVGRMAYLSPPPERWADLTAGVIQFSDPVIADDSRQLSHWDPKPLRWIAL
jgi:hypothetical protein